MSEPKEIHLSEAAKLPLCGCGCGRRQPDCAWRRTAPLTKEQLEHLQYEDVSVQFARLVGLYDGPARPDRLEEVMVMGRGQKFVVGEGIQPGQIARGAWVTTHRGERRVPQQGGQRPARAPREEGGRVMDWRLALKVECPLCREGPGKPCVTWATVDGKKRVMSESVHPDRAAVVIEEHQRTALSVLTQENEQLRAELEVHRAASAECNDALRELAELKAQKHDKQWPAPQPIETAPCETVILAYDAEYKVWEKMYTRRTSPAVRAKKRYPVWLPMPPPPQGT